MLFWRRNVEKELKGLNSQVVQAQATSQKRQKQRRRLTSLFLVYTIFVYSVMLAVIFLSRSYKTTQSKVLITAVPGLIYSLYKTLAQVLLWRETKSASRLKALKDKRDGLIEEFKKQTNYYNIQQVLEGAQEKSDLDKKPKIQTKTKTPTKSDQKKELIRKVQRESAKAKPVGLPESAVDVDLTKSQQKPQPAIAPARAPAPVAAAPSNPTFLDRLADLVLGENENAPNNRYALICPTCFTHNGLASYGQDPSEVQYRCPTCGTMNGEKPKEPEMEEKETSTELKEPEMAEKEKEKVPPST